MTDSDTPQIPLLDAAIIGAGFSGLYAVHRLRQIGLNVQAFERGSDVGGTWYWNRYPGLKCDTESLSYSYTFDKQIYLDWTWSRRFAPQKEVEEYAHFVADRLDLRRSIRFNTSVVSAHWSEDDERWILALDTGELVSAKYLIAGTGPLSTANFPAVDGLENFSGEWHHTGQWPREAPDFAGKRVAVIGTGSSGAQIIGEIAKVAAKLTVFQRTPQYITPARDYDMTEAKVSAAKARFDDMVRESKDSSFGAPGIKTDVSVFDHTPEQRAEVFEAAWHAGAQAFALATYKDLVTNVEANRIAADFVRAKITEVVNDPETTRKLLPDYLFGTKRPIKVDGYYENFNRDNVELVDVREDPIEGVTRTGIKTSTGEHEVDIIVFATGFDAFTGTLFNIDIRGRDGVTLPETWKDGESIETYLGLSVHGFPNFFMTAGPQSPSVLANFLFGIQQNVNWIAETLQDLEQQSVSVVEPTAEAQEWWTNHVQELAKKTLYFETKSWWNGGNVEGKPSNKNFPIYVGGVNVYAKRLAEAREGNYPRLEKTYAHQLNTAGFAV